MVVVDQGAMVISALYQFRIFYFGEVILRKTIVHISVVHPKVDISGFPSKVA